MGKYNSNTVTAEFTRDYIERKLWLNDGKDYVPFLTVRSLPSLGKKNRPLGWKTGRIHHFLSELELKAFYYFEWSNDVVDIKEQYPLLPVENLKNIAQKAGINYPSFAGEDLIMTTDFLITLIKNGEKVHCVRTVKPSTMLEDAGILENFELERRYFESKNIDWAIITDRDLSDIFFKNMSVLHTNKLVSALSNLEKSFTYKVYELLIKEIEKTTDKSIPIAFIISQLAGNLNIKLGKINSIFLRSIVDKVLVFDIHNKVLDTSELLISDIKINSSMLNKIAENQ